MFFVNLTVRATEYQFSIKAIFWKKHNNGNITYQYQTPTLTINHEQKA